MYLILIALTLFSSLGYASKHHPKCEEILVKIIEADEIRQQDYDVAVQKVLKQSKGIDEAYLKESYQILQKYAHEINDQDSLNEAVKKISKKYGYNPYVLYKAFDHHLSQQAANMFTHLRDFGRWFNETKAHFDHKYKGTVPNLNSQRQQIITQLHKEGKFTGAFGFHIHPGTVEIMSNIIATRAQEITRPNKRIEIGRNLILPDGTEVEIQKLPIGPMVGISGMSYPALSMRSIITLIAEHILMSKNNAPILMNTGEGGPNFHLALIDGDYEKLVSVAIDWGRKNGFLTPGGIDEANIRHEVKMGIQARNEVFKKFGISKDDMEHVNIVAQYGTALNGVRDADFKADFDSFLETAKHPGVKMIEFKAKQAAKRGSKNSKISPLSAGMRHQTDISKNAKSPAINPEMDTFEKIKTMIHATKLVTKKPVSLKFAIGEVRDAYNLLEYLRDMNALPDNIQLDASDMSWSSGSGNATPTEVLGNTSLPIDYALPALTAILKKLEIRDQVKVSASANIWTPKQAIKLMALGADYTMGARLWMAMGAGCMQAGVCNTKRCPYGVASGPGTIQALTMNPLKTVEKGVQASNEFLKALNFNITETGSYDWRVLHKTHGLSAHKNNITVRNAALVPVPLDQHIDHNVLETFLGSRMTTQEIDEFVWHYDTPELREYTYIDEMRTLSKHWHERRIQGDEKMKRQQELWIKKRRQRLKDFIMNSDIMPTEAEIATFIRDQDTEGLFIK